MKTLRRMLLLGSASLALGYSAQRAITMLRGGLSAQRRGRFAGTPWQMTWLGWKDVLARTAIGASDDRLLSVAGSIAFFTLLALVPGLSVLISVYGLFTEPAQVYGQIGGIAAYLPEAGRIIIEDQAKRLTTQPPSVLSFNLLLSLAIAGWSASAAIKGVFDGLNVIYGETEKRSFLSFNLIAILTTLGAILLLVAALVVIALVPASIDRLPFADRLAMPMAVLGWFAFLLVACASISVLYLIGPSRRPARWPWVLPGAAAAALLWIGVSGAFSWYVSTLGNYTATYGSLATVVVFMTWLWLSASVILLGAELNAELEHQTAEDTTTGVPKPLGLRGAVVADAIGPAVVSD